MADTSYGATRSEQSDDLRAAVQFAVLRICNAEEEKETANDDQQTVGKMSPAALATLSELTFLYATTCMTPDLEAFSDHANRKKRITVSDVMLLARKNPANLREKLQTFCDRHFDSSKEDGTAAAVVASAKTKANHSFGARKGGKKFDSLNKKRSINRSLEVRAAEDSGSCSSTNFDSEDDIDLNIPKKQKPTACKRGSVFSDSDDDDSPLDDQTYAPPLAAKPIKKGLKQKRVVRDGNEENGSSSVGDSDSVDDEVEVLAPHVPSSAKRKKVTKKRQDASLEDSSGDEALLAASTKMKLSKCEAIKSQPASNIKERRLQLSKSPGNNAATRILPQHKDDGDDDQSYRRSAHNSQSSPEVLQKNSRLQQIMQAMSQDHPHSDDDDSSEVCF